MRKFESFDYLSCAGIAFLALLLVVGIQSVKRKPQRELPPIEQTSEPSRRKPEEKMGLMFTNEIRARQDSNGVDVLDLITSIQGTSVVVTVKAPTNLAYLSPFVGYGMDSHNAGFTSKWWMGFAEATTNRTEGDK